MASKAQNIRCRGKRRFWRRFCCFSLVFLFLLTIIAAAAMAIFPSIERYFYPLRYDNTIKIAAERNGLSPALVAGIILTESGFNPQARSEVGAIGLMQLMPETAWWIADLDSLSIPEHTETILEDPDLNIYLGSGYFSWLLKRFQNRPIEALAAYNAGQNEVDAWLKGKSAALQIESIPVPETRHFVRKVLHSRRKYAELYPQLAEQAYAAHSTDSR